MMQICDQGALNLMAGIVKQAAQGWHNAQRNLRMHPRSKKAVEHEMVINECERFFRSPHFARITGLDGKAFIRALKENEG